MLQIPKGTGRGVGAGGSLRLLLILVGGKKGKHFVMFGVCSLIQKNKVKPLLKTKGTHTNS